MLHFMLTQKNILMACKTKGESLVLWLIVLIQVISCWKTTHLVLLLNIHMIGFKLCLRILKIVMHLMILFLGKHTTQWKDSEQVTTTDCSYTSTDNNCQQHWQTEKKQQSCSPWSAKKT